MPSKLYSSARATLGAADKQSLAAFDRWLSRVRANPSGGPVDGRQLCENLKSEAHFSGGGAFGDPVQLTGFLTQCAQAHRGTGRPKRLDGYRATCGAHPAKGLSIPGDHLPERLLRYSTYFRGAAEIVERVLGKIARADFDAGKLSPEDAFRQVAAKWRASTMLPTNKLGGGAVVWATFRHRKGTPRGDARGMAEALALPLGSGDRILYELAYERDAVTNHRFPTVADAGLMHQLRPAPEVPPDPSKRRTCWGWTCPLGPWPAQPEIVHDNASLQVLRRAPRFVGRL